MWLGIEGPVLAALWRKLFTGSFAYPVPKQGAIDQARAAFITSGRPR